MNDKAYKHCKGSFFPCEYYSVESLENCKCDNPSNFPDPEYFLLKALSKDCVSCLIAVLDFFRNFDVCKEEYLFYCVSFHAIRCFKYLVEEKNMRGMINTSSRYEKETLLLHSLRKWADMEFSNLLIQYGASLDIPDACGATPRSVLSLRQKIDEERFGKSCF